MLLVIARFAFGRGNFFAGLGFWFPLPRIGLGKELQPFLNIANRIEVLIDLVLIVTAKAVAQFVCVVEDEIEQCFAVFLLALVSSRTAIGLQLAEEPLVREARIVLLRGRHTWGSPGDVTTVESCVADVGINARNYGINS